MEQWKNRLAIVTGASSGIGAAIAKDLAKAGMITIGLARRVERVEALKKDLPANVQGNLHAVKCDVSKEEEIIRVFSEIDAKFNGIDVLINNAAVLREGALITKDNSTSVREVLDTNVLGVVFCTREAYKSMEKHGRNSHVVHINSIVGHNIINDPKMASTNIYTAGKFALTAIMEIHRQEFIRSKHHIKVTSVSPGVVKTEMVPEDFAEKYGNFSFLEPEDVSHSILHVLGTPPHVQIHELTIKPFGETF
ncbi:farnesol dehydrogenase-like [Lutzomyia longipalpis]|uniref:farnesol dehydrogenase-like n=1 Tax=Lutzomyia longipalpis TaxID=7200 RepID=UPI0024842A84|nr:farnesol dehydrogenase-like [Lutzomyia longipalpis]